MKRPKLITLGFAIPLSHLKAMVDALTNTGDFDIDDQGSPTAGDGHAIIAKYNDHVVFRAMIHSNRKMYLVSAMEGLLTYTGTA